MNGHAQQNNGNVICYKRTQKKREKKNKNWSTESIQSKRTGHTESYICDVIYSHFPHLIRLITHGEWEIRNGFRYKMSVNT